MTQTSMLDEISSAIADLQQLIDLAYKGETIILHELIDDADDDFRSDFHALALAAMFLQQRLARQEPDDDPLANCAAQQVALAAIFECFLTRHPEVVQRFAEHQEQVRQQSVQIIDRIRAGVHFDNPHCLSCGSESRHVRTDEPNGVVWYRCLDDRGLGCSRQFSNRSL